MLPFQLSDAAFDRSPKERARSWPEGCLQPVRAHPSHTITSETTQQWCARATSCDGAPPTISAAVGRCAPPPTMQDRRLTSRKRPTDPYKLLNRMWPLAPDLGQAKGGLYPSLPLTHVALQDRESAAHTVNARARARASTSAPIGFGVGCVHTNSQGPARSRFSRRLVCAIPCRGGVLPAADDRAATDEADADSGCGTE